MTVNKSLGKVDLFQAVQEAVAFHRREYVPLELRTPEYLDAQAREQKFGRCEGEVHRGFSFGELSFVRDHRNHHNVLATTPANVIKMDIGGYNKTKRFTCEKPFTLTADMQSALRLPPSLRQSQHVKTLAAAVSNEAFFEGFSASGIQYVCRHMYLHKVPPATRQNSYTWGGLSLWYSLCGGTNSLPAEMGQNRLK